MHSKNFNEKDTHTLLPSGKNAHLKAVSTIYKSKDYSSKLIKTFTIGKPLSDEYYCTALYKQTPKIKEIPFLNSEDFPTHSNDTLEKAARELKAFQLFQNNGEMESFPFP